MNVGNYYGVEKFPVKLVARAYSDWRNGSVPVEYVWDIYKNGNLVNRIETSQGIVYFTFNTPGEYDLKLTVKDNENRQNSTYFKAYIKEDTDTDGIADELEQRHPDIYTVGAKNDRYAFMIFPDPSGVSDVVRRYLKSSLAQSMRTSENNIITLYNEAATFQNIDAVFDNLKNIMDSNDILYIGIVGHGSLNGFRAYDDTYP
ncbi:MAG: hypothetical protein NZ894_00075 [Archaeoglobaceae archaeon]|nr:hypothetical protein [Archaeoglobaceae archaeon]